MVDKTPQEKKQCLSCKRERYFERFPLKCHSYCRLCLIQNWEQKLERNKANLSCLHKSCRSPLDPKVIEDLLSEKNFKKFEMKNFLLCQDIPKKDLIIAGNSNIIGSSTVDSSNKSHGLDLEKTCQTFLQKCPNCQFSMIIEKDCILFCENSICGARICRKCHAKIINYKICDCYEETQAVLLKKQNNSPLEITVNIYKKKDALKKMNLRNKSCLNLKTCNIF